MASVQPVRVVTDSTADIPEAISQELGIEVVPCNVHFGQETYRDRIDLSSEEFYRKLIASPVLPTTTQPSVGTFYDAYSRCLDDGYRVLSIHVSAALSGTYNSATQAARMLPEGQIVVVDSRTLSMALGWLAIALAEEAKLGKSLPELWAFVEKLVPRARLVAVVDTLEYLHRGGRIGRLQAFLGSFLQIKPVFEVRGGVIEPLARVRTKGQALHRLAEIVEAFGEPERVAVAHSRAIEEARSVAERLEHAFPGREIMITEIGPVLGVHAGPGAIGVCLLLRG